jgi:hypothetical protein
MEPPEQITLAVGFVRLSAVYEITGMKTLIADHIKRLLLKSSSRDPNANTLHLSPQHMRVALELPKHHTVRKLLVIATVGGYIRSDKPRFHEEMLGIPNFVTELLAEVKTTLTTACQFGDSHFIDPLTGRQEKFRE